MSIETEQHIRCLQAALRVSRGWVITCSESEQARRDLKTVDAALAMSSDATPTATHNEEALREALEAASVQLAQAATQFAFYAEEHAKKGTVDGNAKAATNSQWAEACLEAHGAARSALDSAEVKS